MLIRIVLAWSLFTVLTGLVGLRIAGVTLGGITTLIVIRFLFGAGEAGAYPNIARALQLVSEFRTSGAGLGLDVGPTDGRPHAFGVDAARCRNRLDAALGSLAICICDVRRGRSRMVRVFAWSFRDRPEDNLQTNQAERELIAAGRGAAVKHGNIPWATLLMNGNLLCLYLMYFCPTYGWYFNITYLPGCLETRYDVAPTSLVRALYKGGPLWLGAAGCILGGFLTDRLLRGGVSRRWSRRLPGMLGHLLCAGCCLAAAFAPTAFWFFLAISLAAFFNDLMMGSTWAICQDVGARHTAVLAGFMNTAGSLGAAAAGWFSGLILERHLHAQAVVAAVNVETLPEELKRAALIDGYSANLMVFAMVYLVAALCWFGINAEKSLPGD